MTIGQRRRALGAGLRRAWPWRTRRRALISVVTALALLIGLTALIVVQQSPAVRTSSQFLDGVAEPGGPPVRLDTTLYLPARTPAPAILLAHGFGGSKIDLTGQAKSLAEHGYVVLAYSARGFGRSGGLIHLDSVHYEVADASRLLDWLQRRPEVLQRNGKPVLGVAGSSYGGALALMLGATDHRIGAVAADITWNNLASALFPNNGGNSLGVFKKLWAGYLFSAGFTSGAGGGADPSTARCGRFAPQFCQLYQAAAGGGRLSGDVVQLLADSSPASVLSQMRAPVLLTQGEQDSLFPLSEADANARQLSAAGDQVSVRWRAGGHDAPSAGDNVSGWQQQFFDATLRGQGSRQDGFLMSQIGAGISATNGRTIDATLKAANYPGLNGAGGFLTEAVPLSGSSQTVNAPAGGTPAAVSSIPGLSSALGTAARLSSVLGATGLSAIPGQTATFASAPLDQARRLIGSASATLDVTAGQSGNVTLFAALHDVAPDGSDTLPARLVAPISLSGRPGQQHRVTVRLPWIVHDVPSGHRIELEVSTTDFAYALPTQADSYQVALAATTLALSSTPTTQISGGGVLVWVVIAAIVVIGCLVLAGWRLRRRRAGAPAAELAAVPVVVQDLHKVYGDGYRAVDGVSFRVEHGQVLGLLGPNGAGKTTILRVLMGLIIPTAGQIRVFGEQVVPGAPVLSRLGAFVEGPGFLPHLTGAENLALFWAASGRPEAEAELDTVLEIAGLGKSIERRVKTYSHGMQQRLAIAQAMLGLPEVLVLDEPTNGLDPPQIAEMRLVLQAYAATGRTVIVSSHLLAEVEQTCSHVVVMHRGRLVAAGSVAEVAGTGGSQLAVDDPAGAEQVLAAAGIRAELVPARRALEDVFLDLIGDHDV